MSSFPDDDSDDGARPEAKQEAHARSEIQTLEEETIEAAATAHRMDGYTNKPITLDVPSLARDTDTADIEIDGSWAPEDTGSIAATGTGSIAATDTGSVAATDTGSIATAPSKSPSNTDFVTNTVGNASIPVRAAESHVSARDPLRAYMAEVSRYDLLTVEEEVDLAERYQDHGDPEAAYKLVTANLRLVAKIAFKYRRYYKNVLDLIQEGNIGLMKAVQKFDPNRGVRLSTYARYWIQAYVMYFLLANHRIVKVGTTQAKRKLFYNLNKETRRLRQMGFDPTPERIAESLDVEVKDVIEMKQRLGSQDASLDQPIGQEDDRTLGQTIPAYGPDPDEEVGEAEMMHLVSGAMRSFGETIENARELVIWNQRLMSDDPLTLEEVGQQFGVTRERVRQIEARMKQRLKAHLLNELGAEVELSVERP